MVLKKGLKEGSRPTSSVLKLQFVGATQDPKILGIDEQVCKSNYFIGNDPAKWRTGFPNIYALGDCANIPSSTGKPFPQLGSIAQQCGYWAAKNILAQIAGEPTQPFHYHDKGIMAMIGRNNAVAEIGEQRHEIEGVVAYAAWLGVHAALMPFNWQRVETFIGWAWEYFSRTQALQISDRPDAMQIDWGENEQPPK